MKAQVQLRRRTEFDALRILASFMVIVIHVSVSHWGDLPKGSLSWGIVSFLNSAACCAVPLFVMITGAAFLSREELPPLSDLFKKYILRLVVVYFLWSAFYAVCSAGLSGVTTATGWKTILSRTIAGSKTHLWFLPRIVGTYALLPLLWCLVHTKDGKYVPYVCAMCLIFITLRDTAVALPLPESVQSMLKQFEFPLNSFAPFALLGWYLANRPVGQFLRCRWLMLLYLLAVVARAVLNYRINFDSNTTLPIYILAILLFSLFRRLEYAPFMDRHAALLYRVSKCTLGIYLMHPFFMDILDRYASFNTQSFHQALSIPALSIVIFVICLAISAGLRRIPCIGKWIV